MRSAGLIGLEIALLFGALFLITPYIPSHIDFAHEVGGRHLLALALFGGSRMLRWKSQWWLALLEMLGFAVFVFVLVKAYNLL